MKLKFPLLIVALLFSGAAFSQSTDFIGHIQVKKATKTGAIERYIFEICVQSECETLGNSHGYSLDAIKGLSGGWQRRAGAPVLLVVEGVGGVVVAFVAGALSVPSASAATVSAILWGGAATGASVPSLTIGSDSNWRWLSPAHHWTAGGVKMDMESSVRALSKMEETQATAVMYAVEKQSDLADLYEVADHVARILDSL